MSAAVFAATEGAIAKLALVLLFRRRGLLGRRICSGSHSGSHLHVEAVEGRVIAVEVLNSTTRLLAGPRARTAPEDD